MNSVPSCWGAGGGGVLDCSLSSRSSPRRRTRIKELEHRRKWREIRLLESSGSIKSSVVFAWGPCGRSPTVLVRIPGLRTPSRWSRTARIMAPIWRHWWLSAGWVASSVLCPAWTTLGQCCTRFEISAAKIGNSILILISLGAWAWALVYSCLLRAFDGRCWIW